MRTFDIVGMFLCRLEIFDRLCFMRFGQNAINYDFLFLSKEFTLDFFER